MSTPRRSFSLSLPLGLAVALTLLRLWLVAAQDVSALGRAGHDDRLFAELAASLLAGEWLGTYHERTLIKGPFYSLFLAGVRLAGAPLLLAQHLAYTAACWLVVVALSPLVGRRWRAMSLYLVLLYNPIGFCDGPMTRVMREGIYPALTLLVIAAAAALLVRGRASPRRLVGWSVGLGLALGAFWLTREEGIWLAPTVVLLVGAAAWQVVREPAPRWLVRLLLLLMPFLLAAAVMGGVALVNRAWYGEAVVVEIQGRPFRAAYGALARAGAVRSERYVPVPAVVRQRLYELSPAFAELEPYLEGEMAKRWVGTSRRRTGVEGDLAAGWFLWALREAAAAAGHHGSATAAASYYQRLATEVNGACEAAALPCVPPRATLSPVWRGDELGPLMAAMRQGFVFLVDLTNFQTECRSSVGREEDLELFRAVTGEELCPPEEAQVRRSGWVVSPPAPVDLRVRARGGAEIRADVRFRASPEAWQLLRPRGQEWWEARRARFDLGLPGCADCVLEVRSRGRLLASVPLEGSGYKIDRSDLYLDLWPEAPPSAMERLDERRRALRLHLLDRVAELYRLLGWPLALLAGLGWLVTGAQAVRHRGRRPEWILLTAVLGAVVARLVIIGLIEVTSYRAIRPGYLAPAYPLFYLFLFLTLVVGWRGVAGWWRSRREQAGDGEPAAASF